MTIMLLTVAYLLAGALFTLRAWGRVKERGYEFRKTENALLVAVLAVIFWLPLAGFMIAERILDKDER